MLYVKVMSDENLPDDDSRKSFLLYSGVAQVEFRRNEDPQSDDGPRAYAHLDMRDGEGVTVPINGNVYVMNESGKTIASFGAARLPILVHGSVEAVRVA